MRSDETETSGDVSRLFDEFFTKRFAHEAFQLVQRNLLTAKRRCTFPRCAVPGPSNRAHVAEQEGSVCVPQGQRQIVGSQFSIYLFFNPSRAFSADPMQE